VGLGAKVGAARFAAASGGSAVCGCMVAGVKMGAGTDSPTMGVVATCGSGWHRAWGQNMVQGVDASVWAVAAEAA
jgi:hypothetical protein